MATPRKRAANAATAPLSVDVDKSDSYGFTISPDGKLESTVLMHSRMGIRIEFNLHRGTLALWR